MFFKKVKDKKEDKNRVKKVILLGVIFSIFSLFFLIIPDCISLGKSLTYKKIPFIKESCNPNFLSVLLWSILPLSWFIPSLIRIYNGIYISKEENKNELLSLVLLSLLSIGYISGAVGREVIKRFKVGLPALIFFLWSLFVFLWISFNGIKFLKRES